MAVDLVNDLRHDGFTVVPRAVPPERCAAVVDAIGSVVRRAARRPGDVGSHLGSL